MEPADGRLIQAKIGAPEIRNIIPDSIEKNDGPGIVQAKQEAPGGPVVCQAEHGTGGKSLRKTSDALLNNSCIGCKFHYFCIYANEANREP